MLQFVLNRSLSACLLVSIILLTAGTASGQTLRLAHFMPANTWQDNTLFKEWARDVEAAANGSLQIRVYPGQSLGSSVEGYDNARRGLADIAWTVQGYTANRFPLSQIVELPGLFDSAEVGSCAFQRLYDSGVLDEEYEETRVLYVHVHGPGHLFTRDTPVRTLSDLEGLQIRRPTNVIGNLLRELGAEPVGMPAPQVYEATQRGVIDGFLLPWEAVVGFRANEVVNHYTEVGLYSLAFVTTMNKSSWERLSPEQQAALEAHSGMNAALIAGRGYDRADVEAREQLLEEGTLHTIPASEREEWEAAGERATEQYLTELEAQGLPARQVYRQFQGHVDTCRADLAAGT